MRAVVTEAISAVGNGAICDKEKHGSMSSSLGMRTVTTEAISLAGNGAATVAVFMSGSGAFACCGILVNCLRHKFILASHHGLSGPRYGDSASKVVPCCVSL